MRADAMGVTVRFLQQGRGVEIVAEGVVRGTEVLAANREIYEEPRLRRLRYQLIDKSACTEYALTANDIAALAELDIQAARINPDIVIAIVEAQGLQFSLTELWQAHLRDCPILTRAFDSRDEAEAWIAGHAMP